MGWDEVRVGLRAATIAAVDEVCAGLGDERLYAICLQTDDGGMGVGLCANTEEGFARARDEEAKVAADEAADDAYLRWSSAEWEHELVGWERFGELDEQLEALAEAPGGFTAYFDRLIDAMVDALAHARLERADALAGVTLFATVTDSDDETEVEDRSAERVNPPELAAAFLGRYADS
jgi:hypothetical protein